LFGDSITRLRRWATEEVRLGDAVKDWKIGVTAAAVFLAFHIPIIVWWSR
jgi:hypothetical protein